MIHASVAPEGDGILLKPAPENRATVGHLLRARGIRPRRLDEDWVVSWESAACLFDGELGARLVIDPDLSRALATRRRIDEAYESVTTQARRLTEGGAPAARHDLSDVAHRVTRLDDHQITAVAVMTIPDSWGACLFDEQGTGKTVTTMAAFDILVERDLADGLLVVAPKSMLHEWKKEFETFYGQLYKVVVIEGPRRQRLQAFAAGADVVVINYEGVVSHIHDLATLCGRTRAVLAVDESFFVKNPEAARTRALRRLRDRCTRAFVLCGTPAPNHPRDLVAQFDLVDLGRTFDELEVDDDRDLAARQVRTRLDTSAWIRNRKNDVLNLPERSFRQVLVPMEDTQARAYRAAEDALLLDLRSTSDREYARRLTHFLQRRVALLQIASNPSAVIPGYAQTPGKWTVLDGLVDQVLGDDGKILIWSFYRSNLDALAGRYEAHGLVRVDGSVDGPSRRRAVRAFQEDHDIRVFLGNPAAAGAGLTLHAANVAVYESLSNQAAHYLQSLDRIHRRGQVRDVEYVMLLSQGTIEKPEYERLLGKATSQAQLLGDGTDSNMTRRSLIEDIVAVREQRPW